MVNVKVPPERAILLLSEKVDELQTILDKHQGLEYYDYVGLCSKIWSVVDDIYGSGDPHPEEIRIIGLPTCSCTASIQVQLMLLEVYHSRLLEYIDEIRHDIHEKPKGTSP